MEIKLIKYQDKWLLVQLKGQDRVEIKIVDSFSDKGQALKKLQLYKYILKTSTEEFKKIVEEVKE